MDKKNWLKLFPLVMLISMSFCFLYLIILAWSSGNWTTISEFNYYGEGYLELIISLIAAPFIIWYVIQEIKSWKK